MPTPVYNKPDAILASVTTVLDFIRLWREFKYFHLLTDVQISTLEAKTLPVAEKERYFQDMQILLGYPDSLEEEIQRMENGGGPGNTSLLGGGLAGARGLNQSVLRPSEDTTETLKNILFGEKRTLELTPYQRAVFYTFKIESYRDRKIFLNHWFMGSTLTVNQSSFRNPGQGCFTKGFSPELDGQL